MHTTNTHPLRPDASANKVAIPRLAPTTPYRARRRSARACETCRLRKTKCDGVRPSCGQCRGQNSKCVYEDIKRVRDQKLLGLLSKRTEEYESLLRDLEGRVDTPTAKKIRKALKVCSKDRKPCKTQDAAAADSDSDTSQGSLEAIDMLEEDLNRNETTRAMGFFGKNSEVAWMQRLEDDIEQKHLGSVGMNNNKIDNNSNNNLIGQYEAVMSQSKSQSQSPPIPELILPTPGNYNGEIPLAMMNYHLDDLEIPNIRTDSDPLSVPPREIADKYFDAYMQFVHPTFCVLRKSTFTAQYRQFFGQLTQPPRKWLAILNMVFAIGSRYCKLLEPGSNVVWGDGLFYLAKARQLGLRDGVLFEHTDLQQIQLECLVAVYLLSLGQINRATKFSGLALQGALSLGINLNITDNRTQDASKEARCRLWWSIYSLEHILNSMHGRASCIREGLCSALPSLPFEEDSFDDPQITRLLQDRDYRESTLRYTLFEENSQLPDRQSPSKSELRWTAECAPSPSLYFYHRTDLVLITQAILTRIYSIDAIREGHSTTEYRLQLYGLQLDKWLAKLSPHYKFTISDNKPWHLDYVALNDPSAPHMREKVSFALSYYSARILLCRPCLSQPHPQPNQDPKPTDSNSSTSRNHHDSIHRTKLGKEMARSCLQAACSLISIFPEETDSNWIVRATPWWGVLHYIMQATSALLLCLSFMTSSSGLSPSPVSDSNNKQHRHSHSINPTQNSSSSSTSSTSPSTAAAAASTSSISTSTSTPTSLKPPFLHSLSGNSASASKSTSSHSSSISPLPQPQAQSNSASPQTTNYLDLQPHDIQTLVASAKRGLSLIATMSAIDPAAQRAFSLCDGFVRKLAPALNLDLSDWPSLGSLAGGLEVKSSKRGEWVIWMKGCTRHGLDKSQVAHVRFRLCSTSDSIPKIGGVDGWS
ncbi:Fungal Zn(2)-Cys(6) binuclear cluster domain-containing protein [Penicillium ucsense]|uniref:Fungal Zn(2)-Cys(6) binuclear cluster domain-containing protein n=1 Tax=Penicillium ucsense TaxID=2839758 RepID=A0A8J8VZP2_9EURO|nr:Fungal Zn(2)-Cys(6) binuclear cluster domain-containing protein [Penicillium ucsense]KAF7734697.1 Fungal Zn(2)-Cys(6) binuclear cluster domain-containing protein [Penicillium ucsense]